MELAVGSVPQSTAASDPPSRVILGLKRRSKVRQLGQVNEAGENWPNINSRFSLSADRTLTT